MWEPTLTEAEIDSYIDMQMGIKAECIDIDPRPASYGEADLSEIAYLGGFGAP